MILRSLLVLSLILNIYLYQSRTKSSSEVISTSIQTKVSPKIASKEDLKKSSLNLKIAPPPSPTPQSQERIEEELLLDRSDLALNEQVVEKLKYNFELDDHQIQTYEELKERYIKLTGDAFKIPEDHDPKTPYYPSYKENKKYHDLVAEYHEKLQELLGPEKYSRYEKMRRENNKRVFLDWDENEGRSDLRFMQF